MPHLPRDLAPACSHCASPTQTWYFRPYIMQERSDYRYTRYDIILRKGLQAHGWTPLVVLYEISMILFLWRKEHLDRGSDLFRLVSERESWRKKVLTKILLIPALLSARAGPASSVSACPGTGRRRFVAGDDVTT